MTNSTALAIVIPAYKADFLRETLESIARQTDKRFNLYIGDDNSPTDLYSIISAYETEINIHYRKFEKNLGGTNLVDQWKRCIDLIGDEEWIWLFSDDDLMDNNCVAAFYKQFESDMPEFDLYKFDTQTINEKGEIIRHNPPLSNPETSYNFLIKKLKYEISSFVTEYIFSAKAYRESGGFISFPMAWASDDATWVKLGYKTGIYTIQNANIFWRLSDVNISNTGSAHGNAKCFALIEFAEWAFNFFNDKTNDSELRLSFRHFILSQFNCYKIKLTIGFVQKISGRLKSVLNIDYLFTYKFFLRYKLREIKGLLRK